jgi:OmcA/MtrC family decaheme c-type cytochrome
MMRKLSIRRGLGLAAAAAAAAVLVACGGSSNVNGGPPVTAQPPDVTAVAPDTAGLAASTSLTFTITSVSIQGKPVVAFTVTNQDGKGMTGLAPADLRFNVAKLVPSPVGGPAVWQNYINRASGGAVQGSQERMASGYAFGTLQSLGSGFYTYTFATDITDPAANPCPAACTDAAGKPLDIRYDPSLTHRVTIQQANSAYPPASGIFDYVPAGGYPYLGREVVATATCNSCHVQLKAHGTRVDTRLCVTCHNPGSWVAGSPNVSVDFKVMVHRIHYNDAGAALPSVAAGYPYKIGNTDFSTVTFPQDVRNCARCHDAAPASSLVTATAQGDNWKLQPSIAACGACHDNVYFGSAPDPAKPYQTKAHSGGAQPDDSTCAMCHTAAKFAGQPQNIAVAHDFPARLKAAAAKFKYNILSVASAAPGSMPVVTFSVTDPTNGNKPYDIKADPAFTAGGNSTLTVKLGWPTTDFANTGSGQRFGQPVSINALTAATPGADAGTYVVTSPVAIPAAQTGTMRVMMDGHPAGDVTTTGSFTDRLPVKSAFRDFALTGSVVARRVVVDLAKCDVCHDLLSLHGANRNEEIGVCSVCHNPNATDAAQRPAAGGIDGKAEEAIDFKAMIHGIHAGQASKGGFRTNGLVVYGFGGSVNDFSGVVFPGKLNDCSTCHISGTYQLGGAWAAPTANGILGTTVSSGASATDPADNLRNSPTAAVCSSCHDNDVARSHMSVPFNGGSFSATQAAIAAAPENCAFCHGVGSALDVKTVHGVK